MLENSLWFRYFPETTIREVLAKIYGCDAAHIDDNEGELYAALKRTLTKKELRLFIMAEAETSAEAMAEAMEMDVDEVRKSLKKAYHKVRNKVHPQVKKGRDTAASTEE